MTERDRDADDDDPQLRSPLRDLLRSMPDEDPPERGLGELMAAARAKAEEMATPTWWQRVVALLRRPPVLALATIVILIGGGIVITRRQDAFVDHPASPRANGLAPGARFRDDKAQTPAAAPTPTPAETPTPPPPPIEAAKLETAGDTGRDMPAERPKPRHHESKLGVTPKAPPVANVAPDPTVTDQPTSKPTVDSTDGEAETVEGRFGEAQEETVQQGYEAPVVGGAMAPVTDDAHGGIKAPANTNPKPKDASNAQLLAQCRSAASRGDCAAVRVIARKLADRDEKYYRANVTSDAQLQRCLAK